MNSNSLHGFFNKSLLKRRARWCITGGQPSIAPQNLAKAGAAVGKRVSPQHTLPPTVPARVVSMCSLTAAKSAKYILETVSSLFVRRGV